MLQRILTSSFIFLIAVGGFFMDVHITQDTSESRIIAMMETTTVMAQEKDAKPTQTNNAPKAQSDWLNEGIRFMNVILGGLIIVITPAIVFASWLLSPDFTSGDLFGLRPVMHNLWITVSNIVYFIYAILLIIIALAAILGKEDKFSYRLMLPRLALGMILVPFTWWFVQWTISLATVVTASVVTIPLEVVDKTKNPYFDGNYIPKDYFINSSENTDIKAPDTKKCSGGTGDNPDCTSIRKIIDSGGGAYASMLLYAYDIFKFHDIKKISSSDSLNPLSTAGQLVNQLVIGALMFIVFGVLVIALIFVLLMRTIKLWMYAIFSPLFTLHFVAGKELFGGNEEFSLQQFIGLAFVPAIVGLILSFGLVIVSAMREPPQSTGEKCTNIQMDITTDGKYSGDGGCKVLGIFGNPNNKIIMGIGKPEGQEQKTYSYNVIQIAGITMVFKGQAKNGEQAIEDARSVSNGLGALGGIFGTIIIDIIALVFIWMAFMSVGKLNKTVEKVLEPFKKIGDTIGSTVSELPKYTPIPGVGMSLRGAEKLAAKPTEFLNQIDAKRMKPYEDAMSKFFNVPIRYSEDVANSIKSVHGSADKLDSAMANLKSKGIDFRDAEGQRAVNDMYEAIKGMSNSTLTLRNIDRKTVDDAKDLDSRIKLIDTWSNKQKTSKNANEIITEWKSAENNDENKSSKNNTSSSTNSGTTNITINSNSFPIANIQRDDKGAITNAGEVAKSISDKVNPKTINRADLIDALKKAKVTETKDQDAIIANLPTDFLKS